MSDNPRISITEIFPTDNSLAFLRRLVGAENGEWLGVQSAMPSSDKWELWLRNPLTGHARHVDFNPNEFKGSELAEKVRMCLTEDTVGTENRKVHVSVRDLKQLAEKLLKLSEEIDALYEEKR